MNRIKELWQADKVAANVFIASPSGYATEVLAQAGWDSMTVDLQHGVQDYLSMVGCFQAMLGHPVVPLARVPVNEPGIIGKTLDGGAYGIICPLVNNAEDAARLVESCRYPPRGRRSNGAIRPTIYQKDYMARAEDDVLVMAMIESREATENLPAILDVPGIDAIYIGPNDLGLSMGYGAKMERDEPEILDFYARAIEEVRARGLQAGIHCATLPYSERMADTGFRLITLMNDVWHMLNSARAAARGLHALSGRVPSAANDQPSLY